MPLSTLFSLPFAFAKQVLSHLSSNLDLSSTTCHSLEARARSREGRARQGGVRSQSSLVTTPILCFGFASLAAISLLTRSWRLVEIPGHLPKAAVTYPSAGVSAPRVGAPAPCITQAMPGGPGICTGNPARCRGGVRTAHCFVLTSRGVQALATGPHKPEGSIPKAGATSRASAFSSAPQSWCPPTSCRVSDAAAQPDVPEAAAVPLSATA